MYIFQGIFDFDIAFSVGMCYLIFRVNSLKENSINLYLIKYLVWR